MRLNIIFCSKNNIQLSQVCFILKKNMTRVTDIPEVKKLALIQLNIKKEGKDSTWIHSPLNMEERNRVKK